MSQRGRHLVGPWEGVPWIVATCPHLLAQRRLMCTKLAERLGKRYPAIPDSPHDLKLELPRVLSSSRVLPPLHERARTVCSRPGTGQPDVQPIRVHFGELCKDAP